MKSKISLDYNIVERNPLPELPVPEELMGLIELLRMPENKQRFESSFIEVQGFDSFVLESKDLKDTCNLIRKVHWRARDHIPRSMIVIFPANVELIDHNPRPFRNGKKAKEVNLKHIFGNKIEKVAGSISFAPFDIQP